MARDSCSLMSLCLGIANVSTSTLRNRASSRKARQTYTHIHIYTQIHVRIHYTYTSNNVVTHVFAPFPRQIAPFLSLYCIYIFPTWVPRAIVFGKISAQGRLIKSGDCRGTQSYLLTVNTTSLLSLDEWRSCRQGGSSSCVPFVCTWVIRRGFPGLEI